MNEQKPFQFKKSTEFAAMTFNEQEAYFDDLTQHLELKKEELGDTTRVNEKLTERGDSRDS